MKRITGIVFLLASIVAGATDWPKEIKTEKGGLITVYQPQPESMKGNALMGRAAFSARAMPGDELVFGVFWFSATLATDRDDRTAALETISVSDIKLPGIDDSTKIGRLRTLLNAEIPKWKIIVSLDDITTTLQQEEKLASANLKNDAPLLYYRSQATTLVLIDGEPKLQEDKELKLSRVLNTAFLIIENPDDKKYYLYGGTFWYVSSALKDGYQVITALPKRIADLDKQLKEGQKADKKEKPGNPPQLLISTVPAELIQSKGAADYSSIAGTTLLFVSNSEDDIFKNINDQKFYVLLSGRWYTAPKLEGPWTYLAADQLPADFAKIPEGSAKDDVLSSVAGTQASKDAIMDAQVPQTAKVDRKTATCTVTYDGDPKFEKIEGTSLELAMNTSSTVIKSGKQYFCVETGVWFAADQPMGPWKVSDKRPEDIDQIPPSSSAYNVKYVYIYDSTPEVVYVGYTPGYTGCYVYGPTVVYGTGFYYNPWYGPYYYPRPVTYGFSMHYNPWTGWSVGFHYSAGFFTYSHYHHPGYWGPPMYHPPYHPPYHGGMYGGQRPVYINHNTNININNSNNIYNNRKDVTTSDRSRNNINNPKTKDSPKRGDLSAGGAKNNVYSGKDGSVYQRKENGSWDQRNGNQWQDKGKTSGMEKDFQQRQRSSQQNSNFKSMNQGGNLGGRSGGGGGGRGRRR